MSLDVATRIKYKRSDGICVTARLCMVDGKDEFVKVENIPQNPPLLRDMSFKNTKEFGLALDASKVIADEDFEVLTEDGKRLGFLDKMRPKLVALKKKSLVLENMKKRKRKSPPPKTESVSRSSRSRRSKATSRVTAKSTPQSASEHPSTRAFTRDSSQSPPQPSIAHSAENSIETSTDAPDEKEDEKTKVLVDDSIDAPFVLKQVSKETEQQFMTTPFNEENWIPETTFKITSFNRVATLYTLILYIMKQYSCPLEEMRVTNSYVRPAIRFKSVIKTVYEKLGIMDRFENSQVDIKLLVWMILSLNSHGEVRPLLLNSPRAYPNDRVLSPLFCRAFRYKSILYMMSWPFRPTTHGINFHYDLEKVKEIPVSLLLESLGIEPKKIMKKIPSWIYGLCG